MASESLYNGDDDLEPQDFDDFLLNPRVFISYSWDNEPHKEWVLNLANQLRKDGVEVLFDRYELSAGKSINKFIDRAISESDKILIIFTPNYRLKADNRNGGVGYEYSIMNTELYSNSSDNNKVIPILRVGTKDESIPTYMQQYIHLDMRNDKDFEIYYSQLLREVYNEKGIQKPELGSKPIFTTKEVKRNEIEIIRKQIEKEISERRDIDEKGLNMIFS